MHIKVWRIASLVGGIAAIGVAGLFLYQIFWLENPNTIEGLKEIHTSPIIGVLLVATLFFSFLAGLITFPFYWVRGLRLMLAVLRIPIGNEQKLSMPTVAKDVTGIVASCGFIYVTIWLAYDVLKVKGV